MMSWLDWSFGEEIKWKAWLVLSFLFVICPLWIFKFMDMTWGYRILATAAGIILCYFFAQAKGSG